MHEFSTVVLTYYFCSCNPKSQNVDTCSVPIIRSACTLFLPCCICCCNITDFCMYNLDPTKHTIPTSKNTAWNYPKFHELMLIVDDMSRLGAPQNFCAQRPESLLIVAAKQPSRRAQKRHKEWSMNSRLLKDFATR